jgi:aldose sugar dehydrogenase
LRLDTLVSGLETPWDLVWGPDKMIWMTERGGRISRVDPATGVVQRVGAVAAVERNVSGLMGLAIHPDWPRHPYIYVMYSFAIDESQTGNRLVRMRYANGALGREELLLGPLPGGPNHNGSRLVIGPDRLLYVSVGDEVGDPQDRGSFGGKILRLTLDGKAAPGNPFGNATYSYGHRNPQGLVFNPKNGKLYNSEHGAAIEDEVNLVLRGRNYGWPQVEGVCNTQEERSFCREHRVVEPLMAWTPTIAVAGMDFYNANLITGWKGSLLVAALKEGPLYRLTLSGDGARIVAKDSMFVGALPRLRDVLVGPRGEVYLATLHHVLRLTPRASQFGQASKKS